MKNLSLDEELTFLKQEVDRLKNSEAAAKVGEFLDGEINEKIQEGVETIKEDYKNSSLLSIIVLFLLGALFGRLFSR